jgi:hypothetical protein
MEKAGNSFIGKLQEMPIELFGEIAKFEHGEKVIERIVQSAEKAFLTAYLVESPGVSP